MAKHIAVLLILLTADLLAIEKPASSIIPVVSAPVERVLTTEVGLLYRNDPLTFGAKYVLKNSGIILAYIVEPSDVDMAFMIGRPITLTGYIVSKTADNVRVVQMRNASTFG